MDSYDIVIIGAGPAGSMAAYNLARKFKVLMLEAHKVPWNKSCSGVLIKKAVDLINKNFGHIPDDVKSRPYTTNGITIVNEAMVAQDFCDNGVNVLRDRFDYWLMQKAVEAGTEIKDNSRVVNISENENKVTVTIKGDKVYDVDAKIVLACDGVNGVSRRLTNSPQQNKVVTYQKFYHAVASFDTSKFYAYIEKDFSQYDAWINTKNDCIIVGTIAKKLTTAKSLHQSFIEYLTTHKEFKILNEVKEETWCIPLVIPDFPILLRKKRVFFAGEVAGLLNPFGEGISLALFSGLCFAEACLKQNSFKLCDWTEIEYNYTSSMKNEIEYMKRQWLFLKKFYPYFWNNVLQSNQ